MPHGFPLAWQKPPLLLSFLSFQQYPVHLVLVCISKELTNVGANKRKKQQWNLDEVKQGKLASGGREYYLILRHRLKL